MLKSKEDEALAEQVVTTGDIVGWERERRTTTSPSALYISAEAEASSVTASGPAPAAVPVPADFNPPVRYQSRRMLGKGGMGEVRLCKDQVIGREVAMKRILSVRVGNPQARGRFIREAQIQGQLEHPSILPVYDLGVDPEQTAFFTMKRLRGRTLEEILLGIQDGHSADLAAFPRRRLLQAFCSVCLAVDFAHSRGVLHRDLKPANIMLGDFGEVYVLDWGLAKVRSEAEYGEAAVQPITEVAATIEGQVAGTLAYMSPEQSAGHSETLDARTDVFSLGAILFELLTYERLRKPGTPQTMLRAILQEVPVRPSERAPNRDIAPELDEICMRALSPTPEQRYQTARELHNAIDRFLAGERDAELRKELAQKHSAAAAEAVECALSGEAGAENARRRALQEVGRALALEPTNAAALATLHRVLSEPPRQIPKEVDTLVQADLATREDLRSRTLAISSFVSLFLIPVVLLMGVRDWWLMAAGTAFSVIALMGRRLANRANSSMRWHYVNQMVSFALYFCYGRLLGPLVFMTVPLAVNAAITAAISPAPLRRFVLWSSCGLLIGMVLLEQIGWLTPSYHFINGGLFITPNLLNLPPMLTLALLLIISLESIVTPSLTLGRVPEQVTEAQRRLALQTWHLRQLLPESPQTPKSAVGQASAVAS